jgi:DNA-binding NarL/FixJ family response regulator
MRDMIRVLVADCYAEIRRLFEILLSVEPDIEVVEAAGSVQEAVEKAGRLRPDIVTTCGLLLGGGGIEATLAIRESLPSTKVLLVSTRNSAEFIERARGAGASGYVIKPYCREIGDAVRAVHRGDPFFLIGPEVDTGSLENSPKWIAMWIHAFETWRDTGKWPGRGI